VTDASVNQKGTSLSLLERARARDEAAWARLTGLYAPLLDRWCRQAALQDADAADVRQEVFLAVARGLDGFRSDPARGTFRGWLRTITQNKICDHWRRTQGGQAAAGGSSAYEQLLQVPSAEADGPGPALPEELEVLYRRALELLATDFEDDTWRAFWRVVVEGRPPAEVAEELHLSRNAVYLAKARVLARLREEFQDLIGP
jgi:RNA polymerase sigma-70 factor (ECF subfamily)